MGTINIFSIRFRIVLLSAIGIMGMFVISATNLYLKSVVDTDFKIRQKSQEIISLIVQSILVEEQFIKNLDNQLISEHQKLQNKITTRITEISKLSNDESVRTLISTMSAHIKSKIEIFKKVADSTALMKQTDEELIRKIDSIARQMDQSVAQIDKEQTELSMTGEIPDPLKADLRAGLNEFSSYWKDRLLNINSAFIKEDIESYKSKKDKLYGELKLKIDNISAIAGAVNSQELKTMWETATKGVPEINNLETEIMELWQSNSALMTELASIGTKARITADSITQKSSELSDTGARKGEIAGWTVTAGAISVMLILGFMIIRAVISPIRNTVQMIRDIAEGEGDLTRRLSTDSKDEISELAKWFNVFTDHLRNMMGHVTQDVLKMKRFSDELSDIAKQLAKGSGQTTVKATDVSTASAKMSSNMRLVSSAMEDASKNVNLVATAAEEMTSTINEIAQNTENARHITGQAVNQSNEASAQVVKLGEAANEIGKAVESITEISAQVNLLALNATIEAARAGEAGKGFAVVANEIKTLAIQTSAVTNQIKQRVQGIQTSTASTVSQINSIQKVVHQVNDTVSAIATAVEEQSVTTKEIALNVFQVSEGIVTTNHNVAQSSSFSENITHKIVEVTNAAANISQSSSQVNRSAESLSVLALQLETMVSRFKI